MKRAPYGFRAGPFFIPPNHIATKRYTASMARRITQRELRNDTPNIMRAVEEGDSFVLTRNGTPVADIVPHSQKPTFVPFGELLELLGDLPSEDPERFFADVDRAADPDPHRGPGEPEQ